MTAQKKSSSRLTRREMLKLSGALGAGSLLAACAPATTPAPTTAPVVPTEAGQPTDVPTAVPTAAPVQGNVVVMYRRGELSEDQEAQFETDNPNITMDVLQDDFTRFFAMYAAGSPPDLMRVQAPSIPQFLARKILFDLTPYFEVSTVLKPDDLNAANNYYKANSPLDIGSGKTYGMVKDWSPDFSVWIYKPAFEEAGIDAPGDEKPLSYDEIAQLAAKVAKFNGDQTLTWGYDFSTAWIDRIWMNMLAEKEQELYADSFTKINLTGNDEVKKIIQWYYDLAKNKLGESPINPSPSWSGDDFNKGILAMVQWGYWFSGMAETDITKGHIAMLPGPTWAGVRRNPTMTATGTIVSANTQVPDAAWKVYEWYHGLEPSVARAKSGWGVPGLKSQYSLMPTEGDYRQQVSKVLNAEFPYSEASIQFNPFIGETVVSDSWSKNLDQALRGTLTFDDLVKNVENETNQAIKDGIDRIGG